MEQNKAFNKALKILNDDEKMALTLSKVEGRSTWQAGEIMGKAHYKYIEILQRAEKFLELFTKHYSVYSKTIPDEVGINKTFKEYLKRVISKRLKPSEALKELAYLEDIEFSFVNRTGSRKILIGHELLKWRTSDIGHEQYFYNLIMDFDRWNNHRILPLSFQEPHAFKRRQKNRHRKIVELTSNVDPETIMKLEKDWVIPGVVMEELPEGYTKLKDPVYYTYLCKSLRDSEYRLVRIIGNPKAVDSFTGQKIYVFTNIKDLALFIDATKKYLIDKSFKVKNGLTYWPIFREVTRRAVNYEQMERITAERTEYIQPTDGFTKENMRRHIKNQNKIKEYQKTLMI